MPPGSHPQTEIPVTIKQAKEARCQVVASNQTYSLYLVFLIRKVISMTNVIVTPSITKEPITIPAMGPADKPTIKYKETVYINKKKPLQLVPTLFIYCWL